MEKILVVDDEQKICKILSDILSFKGYEVLTASGGKKALEILAKGNIDLIMLDLMMPDLSGKEVLEIVNIDYPQIPVIMISAYGTIEAAVDAIKQGAYDFIEKPLDADRILITARNALDKRSITQKVQRLTNDVLERYKMIGQSKAMKKIYHLIELLASSDTTVLITGDSGTGKELVAQALHNLSPRVGNPFVKINCAAIPELLIESELFGYESGAFSGAHQMKKGKVELSQGGTLFLDEIGELKSGTQAKLLRLLEQKEFERLGGLETITIDFRLIAVTNKNLKEEVEKGNFREDLFYRLDVTRIHIPPLRDRKEDIPELVEFFIKEFCMENNINSKSVSINGLDRIQDYHWPGNVRELKNSVHKSLILSQGQIDIPMSISENESVMLVEPSNLHNYSSLRSARDKFEKEYISNILIKNNWNISKTAKKLKMDRSNLYKRMTDLNIQRENI